MAGKPKPTKLKILNGNPGKRPLNQNEPLPRTELIPCPEWLKSDVIAYSEWNRLVPELYQLGLLTVADQAALELYCSQYSIYREAFQDIKDNGMITTNIRDGEKSNPSVAIAREAAKIIKTMCVEFGLTPSSRGRMSLPNSNDNEDELEKLINGA